MCNLTKSDWLPGRRELWSAALCTWGKGICNRGGSKRKRVPFWMDCCFWGQIGAGLEVGTHLGALHRECPREWVVTAELVWASLLRTRGSSWCLTAAASHRGRSRLGLWLASSSVGVLQTWCMVGLHLRFSVWADFHPWNTRQVLIFWPLSHAHWPLYTFWEVSVQVFLLVFKRIELCVL